MRLPLVCFVFVLSAALSCWLVVWATGTQQGRGPRLGLDAWAKIAPQIEALETEQREPGEARVVFLGDSTTFIPVGGAIPGSLERTLKARRSSRTEVRSLGFSGMSPFDYYYLAAPISRTRADRIVMNVNLGAFGEQANYYSRPELAGWIPPSRWAQAALLPLHWQGLTFDELMMRSTIVGVGAWKLWHALARRGVRLEKAYQELSLKAQGRKQPFQGAFTQRMLWILAENGKLTTPQGPEELRTRYGVALDGVPADHPILRMLHAAVAEYTAAGIPVTVYVSPIDVERLDRVGLRDRSGLAASIERIGTAIRSAGGDFIDLHDLLPSAQFRDPAGHLAGDGPTRVARALAQAIEAQTQSEQPPPGLRRP